MTSYEQSGTRFDPDARGHELVGRCARTAPPVRIEITVHARKRGKERCGLRGKTFERRVHQAWWKGLMAHEAEGELAIWLAAKQKTNPKVNAVRVYQGFAWMFAGERLITVLIVPKELKEAA